MKMLPSLSGINTRAEKIEHLFFTLLFMPLLASGIVYALHRNGQAIIGSDAGYYIVSARNFIETGNFTFDGIHRTNGFHWLWMGVIILWGKIFNLLNWPLDTQFFLNVLSSTCAYFYTLAAYVGFLCLKRHISSGLSVVVIVLTFSNPLLLLNTINGLETSLLLLVLATGILSMQKQNLVLASCMAQLAPLVRVEYCVFSLFLVSPWYKQIIRRPSTILYFLPYTIAVIPGLNFWAGNSLVSSSATAKKFWSDAAWDNYVRKQDISTALKTVAISSLYFKSFFYDLFISLFKEGLRLSISSILVLCASIVFVCGGIIYGVRECIKCKWFLSLPLVSVILSLLIVSASYKILLFQPFSSDFVRVFPVYDYQATWYFVPVSMAFLLLLNYSWLHKRTILSLSYHWSLLVHFL